MLDPFTAFLVCVAFIMLTGAVLGFIHPALPPELQPAGADWRIGTLLMAGGSVLLAARGIRAADWLPPVSNGLIFFGLTLYWRALRRYFGDPDQPVVFAPAFAGLGLMLIFTFVAPHYGWRVLVASLTGAVIAFCCVSTLMRRAASERVISGRVLVAAMLISAAYFVVRGVYVFFNASAQDTLLAPDDWLNILTPLLIALLPTVGTTTFVLLLFERIRRDLHRSATTDALTGLPNRRTIALHGERCFAQARARLQSLSAAIIDIDHFKQINDRFGHDGGDAVLRAVASELARSADSGQLVGRQGGEEFVVLMPDASATEARIVAERFREAVARLPSVNTEAATANQTAQSGAAVTVSVGVATMLPSDDVFDALLRRADRALYAAKADGRNCVRVATA